jgi:hypothetical protein
MIGYNLYFFVAKHYFALIFKTPFHEVQTCSPKTKW